MAKNIVRLPKAAVLTIERVLDEFLTDQQKRVKPKTVSDYKDVVQLLTDYMNGYAHQSLSKAESALFDKHYDADGKEHKEFCQLFGPEKIVGEMGGFLGYFMTRKVMAGGDFKRLAGTVTKKLSKWLAEKNYISEVEAQKGMEVGTAAARDLPKAECAAKILCDATAEFDIDPNELSDDDYLDFDHYTIGKIESGKLWIEVFEEGDKRTIGPIVVPKMATDLLHEGWGVSCALGRICGKWQIVEIANVYPS